MKRIGHAGLLVCLGVILATVLVPNTALAWLRMESPWLSNTISRIEVLWPGVDTVHLLFFALLGVVARLALPTARAGLIILGALLFSAITELLQFFVPGRTALFSDVRDNMLGLLLGLGLAAIFIWLWRRNLQRAG